MKNMIAYCGLDCGKCDAYLATIHDDQALREKTAKLWAQLNKVVSRVMRKIDSGIWQKSITGGAA